MTHMPKMSGYSKKRFYASELKKGTQREVATF